MNAEAKLEILQDSRHPEPDDSLTWVGGHFDPEGFDVNRTNAALRARPVSKKERRSSTTPSPHSALAIFRLMYSPSSQ
jgi:hypothetical protein